MPTHTAKTSLSANLLNSDQHYGATDVAVTSTAPKHINPVAAMAKYLCCSEDCLTSNPPAFVIAERQARALPAPSDQSMTDSDSLNIGPSDTSGASCPLTTCPPCTDTSLHCCLGATEGLFRCLISPECIECSCKVLAAVLCCGANR